MHAVGGAVVGLPSWPGLQVPGEGFPFINRAWDIFGVKSGGGGNGKELVYGHREVGLGQLALCFLEHIDILGDAIHLSIVSQHLSSKIHKLAQVEAAVVSIKLVWQ